ncbi:hypothetical protein BRC88_11570 [Halobacteriales archaeon QS_4_69_225]|nr:MAG: hypothetical protein BRC88_11570 [Halobacteriales archaeon QS_4_69_225]
MMTTTGGDAERSGGDRAEPRRPVTLRSSLVRYDDDPDRRTVYPRGLSGVARMSTWLTADDDAFVDLESAR